jgi:hypothetical protein
VEENNALDNKYRTLYAEYENIRRGTSEVEYKITQVNQEYQTKITQITQDFQSRITIY